MINQTKEAIMDTTAEQGFDWMLLAMILTFPAGPIAFLLFDAATFIAWDAPRWIIRKLRSR